jgi:hypothetical protein
MVEMTTETKRVITFALGTITLLDVTGAAYLDVAKSGTTEPEKLLEFAAVLTDAAAMLDEIRH